MTKPNILLFLTDDHAPWSLPAYGETELKTPHLSRLAAEGTRFANAFTPCPVCSPARACLLTGRTPSQVGIHDWLQESGPAIANRDWLGSEVTLPELLQEAGYFTMLSGKWHLGGSHLTPRGFDRCFGLGGWQGVHNGTYTFHQDGEALTLKGNKSRFITSKALEMLESAPINQPFFLNVGYIATHSPYVASEHDPVLVAEVAALQFPDIPAYIPHPWAQNEGLESATEEDLLQRYRGYYAGVLEIDRNVGRILKWLEDRDELQNTIVIYVSDHGCALGHHGFWGKGNSTRPLNMYDVSLRVPLLMSGPSVARNHVIQEPVDHYDLFEAICDWGEVELREGRNYPGRSLVPLAEGRAVEDWRLERFGEYGDLRMIRTPAWKFVKRYPDGPHELFDLIEDPGELVNLAGMPGKREIQADLEAKMERWYAEHEDPEKSGLAVKSLPLHNSYEAWRDGVREGRGLQAD